MLDFYNSREQIITSTLSFFNMSKILFAIYMVESQYLLILWYSIHTDTQV